MAVNHNGKKPGPLWRFRQHCKSVLACFKARDSQQAARALRRSTFLTIGSFTLSAGVVKLAASGIVLPFATSMAPWILGGVGAFSAFRAWRNHKRVKSSITYQGSMRRAEEAWLEKKQRAPFYKRVGQSIRNGLSRTAAVCAKPFTFWRHKATPDTEAQASPVTNTAPATTTLVSGAANDFSEASQPVQEAADPARDAAVARRAEARAARKNGSKGRFD